MPYVPRGSNCEAIVQRLVSRGCGQHWPRDSEGGGRDLHLLKRVI